MSGDRIRKIDHNPCTHAFTQYSRCEQRERDTQRQTEQAARTGRVWGLKLGRHVREVVVVKSEARTMAAASRCEVAFMPFYVGRAWS